MDKRLEKLAIHNPSFYLEELMRGGYINCTEILKILQEMEESRNIPGEILSDELISLFKYLKIFFSRKELAEIITKFEMSPSHFGLDAINPSDMPQGGGE